ncbi:MAG: carboxylating nicotinate-nucleotide diphosphorylase [Alphaproteobacteria bacterium]|nr:carboxylating nicotinate-nucleotide diphosphorylase [Alphaproteobacteria bacterium]
MNISPLPDFMLTPFVRNALEEDMGLAGDITTNAIIPASAEWHSVLVARHPGIVAGIDLARLAFHLTDERIKFTAAVTDGSKIKPGEKIARISGPARGILLAERTALNFVSRMSGIATATNALVEAVKPWSARIADTRKTTPGLRMLEKYAVRIGGGINHRFGLFDAMLIKDNHISVSGSIEQAVLAARKAAGHVIKIEVEIDTIEQLEEVLTIDPGIDSVLLDNMEVADIKKAVEMIRGRFAAEASGRITVETASAIAATGVDILSAGWITHSAPILDIGLDTAE